MNNMTFMSCFRFWIDEFVIKLGSIVTFAI